MTTNLLFAWLWILAGLLAGALQGLFFHREDFLGGYGSWARRLTRLGHIAFFGTALINLLAAMTAKLWAIDSRWIELASPLLVIGAISMSAVCYAAAFRKPLRHLFFIPVLSLTLGVSAFVAALFTGL